MAAPSPDSVIPAALAAQLQRSPEDRRPIVVMTCGLAGTGKTTLSKAILALYPTFHRISIDEIINSTHGIYGTDFAASATLYERYLSEADEIYLSTFQSLLVEGKDVICEKSFYAKEDRDEYRNMAKKAGARVILVFFSVEDKEVVWQRIRKRSEGVKTANSALDISRETFERYWDGFENPDGEDEIVIEVTKNR